MNSFLAFVAHYDTFIVMGIFAATLMYAVRVNVASFRQRLMLKTQIATLTKQVATSNEKLDAFFPLLMDMQRSLLRIDEHEQLLGRLGSSMRSVVPEGATTLDSNSGYTLAANMLYEGQDKKLISERCQLSMDEVSLIETMQQRR